ncbi:MAG: hypothetical protein E2O58_02205 [Gammaproteobacteria bacterium]|nr:MAG: hypothetical protein E2O58_02205 [Gammaproteobacteria bacterium]
MSIMELGALGEFLGSIGVIATLIYLAVQIRANTNSTKAETFQRLTTEVTNWKSNTANVQYHFQNVVRRYKTTMSMNSLRTRTF